MQYKTVASYLEQWLSTRARYSLRPRTHEGYRIVVRKHLDPTLGHLGLRDLTAAHVDALIWSKIDEGLSPRSAQYIHAVLRSALSDAERMGLIDTNVAKQVRPVRYDPKPPHPLRAEEVRALLVQVRGDRLESLFVLAVCTGMRLGEILALRCGEVALAEGTVAVTGTLQRYDGRLRRLPPKSASSRRTIALSPAAQASLRAHCERKSDEALRDRAFLFTSNAGTPLDPRNVLRQFHRHLESASIPRRRFHDLRHTFATLLLEANVHHRIVMEILGHSSISTTLDLYSHVSIDLQRSAVASVDSVLGLEHAAGVRGASDDWIPTGD